MRSIKNGLKSKGLQIEAVLSKRQVAYLQNWVLSQFARKSLTENLTEIVGAEFRATVARTRADKQAWKRFEALCLVAEISPEPSKENDHDNGNETPDA